MNSITFKINNRNEGEIVIVRRRETEFVTSKPTLKEQQRKYHLMCAVNEKEKLKDNCIFEMVRIKETKWK